jgi:hypothetical protein
MNIPDLDRPRIDGDCSLLAIEHGSENHLEVGFQGDATGDAPQPHDDFRRNRDPCPTSPP